MYLKFNKPLFLEFLKIGRDEPIFEFIREENRKYVQDIVDELNLSNNVVAYNTLLYHNFRLIFTDEEIDLLCMSLDTYSIYIDNIAEVFSRYLISNAFKLIVVE